jgi:hypothetical protein
MKIGTHHVKVIDYVAGTNKNDKKVLDLTVMNRDRETINIQLYFVSPKNIAISLEQMRRLGWFEDAENGLDSLIGGKAQINVYEEEYEDNNGEQQFALKAEFARGAVRDAMSKEAAHDFLSKLAKPKQPQQCKDYGAPIQNKEWPDDNDMPF